MARLIFDKISFLNNIISVRNSRNQKLGTLWYNDRNKWDCWVWEQGKDIIMSADCLQEIVDKLKERDKGDKK